MQIESSNTAAWGGGSVPPAPTGGSLPMFTFHVKHSRGEMYIGHAVRAVVWECGEGQTDGDVTRGMVLVAL